MQAAVTTGSAEHPAFPARWLYGVLRALPGDRLSCPRYRATQMRRRVRDNACALREASAPGCQDHTAWPSAQARSSAPSKRTLRARTATAPRLALRDDRDAPLPSRRDAEDITRFLEKRKRNVDVEARQASSIAAPTRSALQASDLASLRTLEQPMLRLSSSSSWRPSAHQRKPSVLAGDNVHGCKGPRSARNQNSHCLMSHWHQPFVLAVLSRAARKPLASLMASSLAQKCMKNSRGCSSNI